MHARQNKHMHARQNKHMHARQNKHMHARQNKHMHARQVLGTDTWQKVFSEMMMSNVLDLSK